MRTKKVEKNTAAKKSAEKKAVAAVKPVAAAAEPVSEVKAEVKVEEPVKETPAEAKPVAVAKKPVKAVAAKKPAAKTTAKKETAPKAAKTATKAAKTVSQKIVLQVKGRELDMESISERVKEAYVAEGHSASAIKNIAIYIKPEENMVYYVIDDYASGISLY